MRFFCSQHEISFSVEPSSRIRCDVGAHDLGKEFPKEDFWEYCCRCQNFWPSELSHTHHAEEPCRVCRQPVLNLYLCDRCGVMTRDSAGSTKRPRFTIAPGGGQVLQHTPGEEPRPGCPGCLLPPQTPVRMHQCETLELTFATARAHCPFCLEPVVEPPSFPCTVEEYLRRTRVGKVRVKNNLLSDMLVEDEEGDLVLIAKGRDTDRSILLPQMPRLMSKQEYHLHLETYYRCDKVAAGEIWITNPAVVDPVEGGWKLREAGRLELRNGDGSKQKDAPAPPDAVVQMEVPTQPPPQSQAASTCPQCATPIEPGSHDCPLCRAEFGSSEAPLDAPVNEFSPEPELNLVVESVATKKRTGLIAGIIGIIVVTLVGFGVYLSLANSLEAKLDHAIESGNLLAPPGRNAYELYQQLKRDGNSASALRKAEAKLLPLLTQRAQSALTSFAQVGTKEPSIPEWEETGRILEWATEIKPDDQTLAARRLYCTGRIAYLQDNKDEAYRLWKRAGEMDSTWALPVNGVGLIHSERREYSTARPYFREAVRRDPDWAVPYNNLGTSYFFEKKYDEAESFYQQAVEHAPRWARPHAWLGDIARLRKDYSAAAQEYELVLDANATGTSNMNLDKIRGELERMRSK